MFDDIIKKPKYVCEINEDEVEFTKEYEKWIKEYQKLFKDLADDEHPQYFMEEKPKLQGTWNCREIIENVIKEAQEYDVYIKPVKAAEFIVFNSVITKTGAIFNV